MGLWPESTSGDLEWPETGFQEDGYEAEEEEGLSPGETELCEMLTLRMEILSPKALSRAPNPSFQLFIQDL